MITLKFIDSDNNVSIMKIDTPYYIAQYGNEIMLCSMDETDDDFKQVLAKYETASRAASVMSEIQANMWERELTEKTLCVLEPFETTEQALFIVNSFGLPFIFEMPQE